MSKFKVGDKVRCISTKETELNFGHNMYMMLKGDFGVVTLCCEDDSYLVSNGSGEWFYHKDDLEVILEETVDKTKQNKAKYYAMFNDITIEILALSLTTDQRNFKVHQIRADKGSEYLRNFKEIELWLDI